MPNKEIARRLKVTTGTTKIHLHHIFRKIGVRNRTSLANMAFQYAPQGQPDQTCSGSQLGKKFRVQALNLRSIQQPDLKTRGNFWHGVCDIDCRRNGGPHEN